MCVFRLTALKKKSIIKQLFVLLLLTIGYHPTTLQYSAKSSSLTYIESCHVLTLLVVLSVMIQNKDGSSAPLGCQDDAGSAV